MINIETENGDELKDAAFRERLEMLIKEHSVRGLARRIGIPNQSLGNYLKGSQPPLSFGRKLVETLGVNPSWLLTGEGSPMLSDVPENTSRTASNLLELVEAMSAVTRMRLGALAGKEHMKVLRELNDALTRYEELRARLSEYSRQSFSTLLDQLKLALQEQNANKAQPLVRAGEQIARLCDDQKLKRDYNRLRAHYEHQCGNNEEATRLLREVVFDNFLHCDGELDERGISDAQNLVATLRLQLRLREAQHIAESALMYIPDISSDSSLVLLATAGWIDTDLGNLRRGLERLRRALICAAEDRRLVVPYYATAQFFSCAMTWRQVREYCRELPVAAQIAPLALWSENVDDLVDALKLLGNHSGPYAARAHFYIKGLLSARKGDTMEARQLDEEFERISQHEASVNNTYVLPVIKTHIAHHSKQHDATLALFYDADQRLLAAPHVSLSTTMTAIHHRNALRLSAAGITDERLLAARKRALRFFKRRIKAGYAAFRTALEN